MATDDRGGSQAKGFDECFALVERKQRMGADDLERIRTVLFDGRPVHSSRVTRETADFLFDLNDEVTGGRHPEGWQDLFVEAITAHVADGRGAANLIDTEEGKWLVRRIHGDFRLDPVEEALLDALDRRARGNGGVKVLVMAVRNLLDRQAEAYVETFAALARALGARDNYTKEHSKRVVDYSLALGRGIGLSENKLRRLRQGALMHDLGKIAVPDAILLKNGPLTADETALMRLHPLKTREIIMPLEALEGSERQKVLTSIAAYHHEWWNGKGYPEGLKGEAIPQMARIVAIADTWDAMTSDRSYKKKKPWSDALGTLRRERDFGQWEPRLIDVFIRLVETGVIAEE